MAGYNRERAVAYAIKYGLNPNPAYRFFGGAGGDCTNYISQCLHAGNIPMDRNSKHPWYYAKNSWSFSWSVAHSLYWCFKNRAVAGLSGLKGLEVNGFEELKLGDIIQYERDGRIYHTGIITAWVADENGIRTPLISQHTFNAVNISWIKPAADKTHFMKIII